MKVAIVSGGTSGIGKGAVLTLLEEGFAVVTFSRSEDAVAQLEKELAGKDVLVCQGDVTDEEAMQALVETTIEKYGRIDVLVNNAGIGYWAPAREGDIEKFRKMLDINVVGVAILTKCVLQHMKEGQIINIASVAGKKSYVNGSFYCATKHAVIGYTNSLRLEVGPDIKVCAVCPGMVATNLFPAGVLQKRKKASGSLRLMDVKDINKVIRLLVNQSPDSDIHEITLPTA